MTFISMKANRRSLKIKSTASVVDAKLKGRVEKAQSFAKAVLFSLLILIIVGLYVRWDTLVELRQSSVVTTSIVSGNDKDVDNMEEVDGYSDVNIRTEEKKKYERDIAYMKSRLQDKNLRKQSTEKISKVENAEGSSQKKDVSELHLNSVANIKTKDMVSGHDRAPSSNSKQPILLTKDAKVSASVNGNLGPPSVVTSPSTSDWLKDRWQSAKDLTGAPIPGPHWLLFDLPTPATSLSRVLIDYEVALSKDYSIEIYCSSLEKWQPVHDTRVADASLTRISKKKQHIIHDITVKNMNCQSFNKIRLRIRSPATRFGTSIWRFEAYG